MGDNQKLDWMGWIANLYVYAILFGLPLMLSTKGYTNLTFTKFLYFAVLSGFLIAAALARAVMELVQGARPYTSFTTWAFTLYLLAALLSIVFSPYKEHALLGAGRYEGILTLFLYLTVFYVVARYVSFSWWHVLAFGASMTVVCVIGVLQYYGVALLYPLGRTFQNSSFLTTIGNVDFVSGMICLALPLCFAGFVRWQKLWGRLLFIPLLLCAFILSAIQVESGMVALLCLLPFLFPLLVKDMLTFSRFCAAALAVAFGVCLQQILLREDGAFIIQFSEIGFACFFFMGVCILLQFFALLWPKDFSPVAIRVVSVLLILAILAGGFVAAEKSKTKQEGFVYEFTQLTKGNVDDSFGTNRIFIWRRTLPLIRKRPFLGYGPDSFRWVFTETYEAEVKARSADLYYDAAHNDYLQIGVNYGLIGLILYLTALLSLLIRGFFRRKENPLTAAGFLAGLCYSIQIFFSFSVPIVAPAAWVVLGLLEGTLRQKKETVQSFSPEAYVNELLDRIS